MILSFPSLAGNCLVSPHVILCRTLVASRSKDTAALPAQGNTERKKRSKVQIPFAKYRIVSRWKYLKYVEALC